MSKFPNYLKAFRDAAGLSGVELAKRVDTSPQNVSRIERGERELSRVWAERFAPHLKTDAQALLFPSPEQLRALIGKLPPAEGARALEYAPLDEMVPEWGGDPAAFNRDNWTPKVEGAIPEIDAKAGAGEGSVGEVLVLPLGGGTVSAHRVVDEWPLPRSWLREATQNPDMSIVMQIDGDSMMPNYAPGDRVLVDLSQDQMMVDGVYLISYDLSPPQIKRLQRIPLTLPAKVAIKSDNPNYDRFDVELDSLRIHGRVCAYVGRR